MDIAQIHEVQDSLKEQNLDGWLLADFRSSNDLACQVLSIGQEKICSRRWFYWIPQEGEPVKLSHRIESHVLDHLPGKLKTYLTWEDLKKGLDEVLQGCRKVAMEYSPNNAIPYVSKVDGGTVDLVRASGVEVASSADILQHFTSVWDEEKVALHLQAAHTVQHIVEEAWALIGKAIKEGQSLTEWDVQQFILSRFAEEGYLSEDPPICAVNAHSADPHYMPTQISALPIEHGDWILIDLSCRANHRRGVFADITRVAVAADRPTPRQNEIFGIVKQARDRGTSLVRSRFEAGLPLRGCEVDDLCRRTIAESGYGQYFIHRTGHNIGQTVHGSGAHLDNFETSDRRHLLPGTCFTIEPGIYLPEEFGVRLEYDVLIHKDGRVQVTGGIQEAISVLL